MAKIRLWQSLLKKFCYRIAFFTQYYAKKTLYFLKKRAPHFRRLHINAFPAVHLKPPDVFDFAMKFSSELLVLVLAVAVAGLNLRFFSFGNQQNFNDQSLAAGFLSAHPALNEKLAEKNGTVITVVTASELIARAQADDSPLPNDPPRDSGQTDAAAPATLDDNGITAPSPDSIKAMVASVTKKIYRTRAGDTLGSIAKANGISADSIRWSNPALTSGQLKPGWDLIIPPVDGVAVTADANTTLPDLAAKYNPLKYNPDKKARDAAAAQSLDTIIAYNGLDSAEDINAGDFLVIPGGVVAAAPVPKAARRPKGKTIPAPDNSMNNITSIGSGYDGVNHFFPKGYCTYYVASKMKITFGGNAKNWLPNAAASGYVTGKGAAPHSAVVLTGNTRTLRRYGHVAYVESVNDDSTITISEMNYDHFNRVDTRTVAVSDPSIRGYIYP